MAEREFLSAELIEFENVLSTLSPRSSSIDRDRLLFLAGKASAAQPRPQIPHRQRLWQLTTIFSSTVAIVLGILLSVRGEPQVIREIEYVERTEASSPESGAPVPSLPNEESLVISELSSVSYGTFNDGGTPRPHYLQLRNVALSQGLEAMTYLSPTKSGKSQRADKPSAPVTRWSGLLHLWEQQQKDTFDKQESHDLFEESLTNPRGEQL